MRGKGRAGTKKGSFSIKEESFARKALQKSREKKEQKKRGEGFAAWEGGVFEAKRALRKRVWG